MNKSQVTIFVYNLELMDTFQRKGDQTK